jgi:hypothetical protein
MAERVYKELRAQASSPRRVGHCRTCLLHIKGFAISTLFLFLAATYIFIKVSSLSKNYECGKSTAFATRFWALEQKECFQPEIGQVSSSKMVVVGLGKLSKLPVSDYDKNTILALAFPI